MKIRQARSTPRPTVLKFRDEKRGRNMKSSPEVAPPVGAEGEVREGANVDKIRDILFGTQMRDYDKRFTRLEERLAKDAAALREELKKRIDGLEAFVHQEVDSLGQRLKNEKTERAEAHKDLEHELRESGKALEKRIGQLDDELAKASADLRAKIPEQSKMLEGEIEDKHRAISASLDREVQTLQADKPDRKALADMFTELAMRLKEEFVLPDQK